MVGAILCIISSSYSQNVNTWDKWSWLIGEWQGEGSGKPGQGSGTFNFKTDLDGKILVRRSHSEYPATDARPATIHEDLMVVYTRPERKSCKSNLFRQRRTYDQLFDRLFREHH